MNTLSSHLRLPVLATMAASLLAGCGADAVPPTAKSTLVSHSIPSESKAIAILAGGCFWCTEAVFEIIDGVGDVESGYIGGQMVNPNYKAVCTGQTGHAEAVRIEYDKDKISYEEILKIFFKTHDPTTLNRQGADVGTQYRSAIFYDSPEEKLAAEKFIEKIQDEFRSPIVTKLEETSTWYPAEEYHQDYFQKNPYAGYCQAVVSKKVRKTTNLFKDKLKVEK